MIPANIVRQTLLAAEAAAIDRALRNAIDRNETATMHNALLSGGDANLVLNHAISKRDDELIKTAMAHNADPMILALYAVATGKQEWLDVAIEAGAVTAQDQLSDAQQDQLYQAFSKNMMGNNSNPILALQAGLDPDAVLYRSITVKNLTGVDAALNAGANPNNQSMLRLMNNSGLHISHMVYDNYNEHVFERLIKAGMTLEERDSYGSTPLYRALTDRNYARAEFMIKQGANPLAASGNGVLALQLIELNSDIEYRLKCKLADMMMKSIAEKKQKQTIVPDFNDVSMQQPVKLMPQIKINQKRAP